MAATLDELEIELEDHEVDFANPHRVDWEQAGAPPRVHFHDDRYYVKREMAIFLSGKSDVGHVHDDRYYTQDQVFQLLSSKSNVGHTHDSRYYTEVEIDQRLLLYALKSDSILVGNVVGLGTAAFRDVGVNPGEIPLIGTTGKIPVIVVPEDVGTQSFAATNIVARGQVRADAGVYLFGGTIRSSVVTHPANATLTASSARVHLYNGAGGHSITLPIVSSSTIGIEFIVKNIGNGTAYVRGGGADLIFTKSNNASVAVVPGNAMTFVASITGRWIAI